LDIIDFTGTGYVNRWELVDGYPRCISEPVPEMGETALAALKRNAAVRAMMARVSEYEKARALVEHVESLEPVDGEPLADEATLAAYDEAVALLASASDVTKAHALWRTGEPLEGGLERNAWVIAVATTATALNELASAPLESDPRPVPKVIQMWRAKAVLKVAGMLESADAIVAASGSPALEAFWEYAPDIHRDSPTLAAMAAALNLDDIGLDDLFRQAASFAI
jgi:hypothetical protein